VDGFSYVEVAGMVLGGGQERSRGHELTKIVVAVSSGNRRS